jgi:hypothetical protein
MTGIDPDHLQRAFAGLMLVVMALFVAAGRPLGERWRRRLRVASIVVFAIAVALALVAIAVWWMPPRT